MQVAYILCEALRQITVNIISYTAEENQDKETFYVNVQINFELKVEYRFIHFLKTSDMLG